MFLFSSIFYHENKTFSLLLHPSAHSYYPYYQILPPPVPFGIVIYAPWLSSYVSQFFSFSFPLPATLFFISGLPVFHTSLLLIVYYWCVFWKSAEEWDLKGDVMDIAYVDIEDEATWAGSALLCGLANDAFGALLHHMHNQHWTMTAAVTSVLSAKQLSWTRWSPMRTIYRLNHGRAASYIWRCPHGWCVCTHETVRKWCK